MNDPRTLLTDEEIVAAREQLRRASGEARRVLRERGVTMHPRVAEARARAEARKQTSE